MQYQANPRRGLKTSPLMMRTVGICMIMSSIACSSDRQSLSEAKHNLGQPVRSSRASQFIQVDAELYADVMAPLVGVNPRDILPATHPLAKRLQYWLDAVDRQIRTNHPKELARVPKPLIQVVKDATANAFVAPAPVCFDVSVKIPGAEARDGLTLDRIYVDLADGTLSDFPQDVKCLESERGVDELREILADAKGKLGDCHYEVSDADQLLPSEGCKVDESLSGVSQADRVVFMKTASVVTVFTGIVPLMTEEAMVAAVTHELGHYYRSHSTVQDSEFGYFYKLAEKQPAKKPEPDLSLIELGQAAVDSSNALNSSELMSRIAGQKLRTELYFAAGSVVKGLCKTGKRCPVSCMDTFEYMLSREFDDAMGFFPFSDKEKADADAYGTFEKGALACFEAVGLAANPKELESASIGWDVVSSLVKSPTWPSWLSGLPGSVQRAVGKLNETNSQRLAKNPPRAKNLAEAFLLASKVLEDQDDAHAATLKKAQQEGLGQYTIEQEADEFSAEWVANSGVSPVSAVEAMRSLGKGSETSLRGFILGEQECESLWAKKWANGGSGYYFVPVGDYSEIHHSTCYRMFNLEREIAAHDYKVAKTAVKVLPVSEWSKLQKMAVDLSPSEDSLSSLADIPLMTKFRSSYLKSCSYASRFH